MAFSYSQRRFSRDNPSLKCLCPSPSADYEESTAQHRYKYQQLGGMKSHSQCVYAHRAPTKHGNTAHKSLRRIPLIGMGLLFPCLHRWKGFSKVLNLTSALLCSHCGTRGSRSVTPCHWWSKELSPSSSGGDAGLN